MGRDHEFELHRLKMKEKLTQYYIDKLKRATDALAQMAPTPIADQQVPAEVQRMREVERVKLIDRIEQINQDLAMVNLLLT